MMRRLTMIATAAALCLAAASPASAQTTHDLQTWSALFATAQLQEQPLGLTLWFDGHVRRGDAGTVGIVRPGLGYRFKPWISVWAGYAWVPTSLDEGDALLHEHRAWEQVILSTSLLDKTLNLQSRTRLEQRWREGSEDTGLRARQFLRADYRPHAEARWGAVLWDELFWGLNAPDFAPQGFDQNRLFIGPALYAMPNMRIEFGYLSAILWRDPTLQIQHALAINFFTTL